MTTPNGIEKFKPIDRRFHFITFPFILLLRFFSVSKSPLACGACATPPENAVISPSIYAPLAVSTSSSFRTEDEGVEVMETNGIIHTRTHTYTHPPTHTHAHAHSGWDTVGGEWVVQREQRSIYSVSEIHKWWIILNWSLLLLFFFFLLLLLLLLLRRRLVSSPENANRPPVGLETLKLVFQTPSIWVQLAASNFSFDCGIRHIATVGSLFHRFLFFFNLFVCFTPGCSSLIEFQLGHRLKLV